MRKPLLALILVLVPTLLFAVPKEEMVFTAVSPHAQNQKKIEKGIEAAIDDMSFITRPIARAKLEKSNIAFKTVTFDFPGNKVSITHDDRKPVVSPADGGKAKWTREDGETFTVSQKVEENKITQIFYGEDGNKTLVYDFGGDFETMKMSVKLESPKLPKPMMYQIDYKR